ncbi:hypothetical protein Q8F55_004301 [Vanrija albida]|uniref:Maltose/galactoside acetyltransferase domain-containing protein n=1 Tax=Vanrija albida TaxID=181172 RepID=A0ABR3Q6C4_9TREE
MTFTPPATAPALLPGEDYEQLENMLAGRPYLASDPYLDRLRVRGFETLYDINRTRDNGERMAALKPFLDCRGGPRNKVWIAAPFTCEYGFNVSLGDDVCFGPNCTLLDVAKISIGDRTMIGANTQFYTPGHPLSPEERDGTNGAEWAKPITIGSDVWIGGGVIILGGVTVGDGVTIGAGSVVTKDVESRTVVVGNPARVIKRIPLPGAEGANGEKKAESK